MLPMPDLTDLELEVLEFEGLQWRFPAAKQTQILERFEMTETRYFQVVNALIDRPEALAAYPMTVKRLQRLRDGRRAERTARRPGFTSAD